MKLEICGFKESELECIVENGKIELIPHSKKAKEFIDKYFPPEVREICMTNVVIRNVLKKLTD